VAAVSLVDIGSLDRAAGECLGAGDDVPLGVTVVRVIRQRPGVQHEQKTERTAVVGDDGGFDADLWTTPALQEESTNGCSVCANLCGFDLRLSPRAIMDIRLLLSSITRSRRAMASNQASEVSVQPLLDRPFRLANLGGILSLSGWTVDLLTSRPCLTRCGP